MSRTDSVRSRRVRLKNSDYIVGFIPNIDEDDPITELVTAFERKHVPEQTQSLIENNCKL